MAAGPEVTRELESSLGFLLVLAIIIFSAKAAGYLSQRLHQPAVLGELLAGLILGPTLINVFALTPFSQGHLEESVSHLAETGVAFLMFMAGLEIDLSDMRAMGKVAVVAGGMGVIVPLLLGASVALAFSFPMLHAVFIGLILTATSVSISAQTLMEMGLLRSREGLALLAAAVVDDVMVILLLSAFLALTGSGEGAAGLIVIGLRMVVYLGAAAALGWFLFDRFVRLVARLPISEGLVAAVIVVVLLYAWAAEAIGGMAAITGAFVAGVLFARTALHEQIRRSLHTITYGLLVPVFFVSVGLRANGRALGAEDMWFTLAILVAAILGKIIGCGLGARLSGFNNLESLRVGVGMVSRGEVGLIVASVGLVAGMIDQPVYAQMVIMVLATTLLTPVMLRAVFGQHERVETT